MFADKLQQALAAYKAGDKAAARQMIAVVLKVQPTNADAWYMAAFMTEDPDKRIQLLERTLAIDPNHAQAQITLKKLRPSPFTDPLDEVIDQGLKAPPAKRRFSMVDKLLIAALIIALVITIGLVTFIVRSNQTKTAAIAALPEMYIKDGLTLRYPTGWKLDAYALNISLTYPPGSKPFGQFIGIDLFHNPSRANNWLTAEECNEPKLKNGIPNSDGTVLIKPNGNYLPITTFQLGNLAGSACGYRSENTMLKVAYIRLTDADVLSVIGYSNDADTFDLLFDQIVQSIQVDVPKVIAWGTPTPFPPLSSSESLRDRLTQSAVAPFPTSTNEPMPTMVPATPLSN